MFEDSEVSDSEFESSLESSSEIEEIIDFVDLVSPLSSPGPVPESLSSSHGEEQTQSSSSSIEFQNYSSGSAYSYENDEKNQDQELLKLGPNVETKELPFTGNDQELVVVETPQKEKISLNGFGTRTCHRTREPFQFQMQTQPMDLTIETQKKARAYWGKVEELLRMSPDSQYTRYLLFQGIQDIHEWIGKYEPALAQRKLIQHVEGLLGPENEGIMNGIFHFLQPETVQLFEMWSQQSP